jgi:hypothetical protein
MCENLYGFWISCRREKLALSLLLNFVGAFSVLCVIRVLVLMYIEFWFC